MGLGVLILLSPWIVQDEPPGIVKLNAAIVGLSSSWSRKSSWPATPAPRKPSSRGRAVADGLAFRLGCGPS